MMVAFVVEALLFRFGELKLDHGLFINEAEGIGSYQILVNKKSKLMPRLSIEWRQSLNHLCQRLGIPL